MKFYKIPDQKLIKSQDFFKNKEILRNSLNQEKPDVFPG
jgi:hypothetical protein